MREESFRQALAVSVEEKEITEVIDALSLNRRAYNKLLKATNGGENGGDEDGKGGINERQARILLSIIEAMAKRLTDLTPALLPSKERTDVVNPLLEQEDYEAAAQFLEKRREARKVQPKEAGSDESG